MGEEIKKVNELNISYKLNLTCLSQLCQQSTQNGLSVNF